MIEPGKMQLAFNMEQQLDESLLSESVDSRNIFYRLSESEIFSMANEKTRINKTLKLENVLPMVMRDGQGFTHVKYEDLDKEIQFTIFESNRFKTNSIKTILELIKSKRIVLVYSEMYKIPTTIPFIFTVGNNATVYLNISDYAKMDEYGTVKITQFRNYNAFMAGLFAAAFTYSNIKNPNYNLNSEPRDGLVSMYSNMLSKVIHGICHLDPITKDKITYLSYQFALIQMYGTELGIKYFQTIREKRFKTLSKVVMDSIDNIFNIDAYDTLSLFVTEITNMFTSTKKLTVEGIFERWVKMFGASTALSIDYLGYHIYTFAMLIFESPLVSRLSLETTITQKLGSDTFAELSNIITRSN